MVGGEIPSRTSHHDGFRRVKHPTSFTIEQHDDGTYWYRCHECGHGAGYTDEELCKLMAGRDVQLPHIRP
jgi:hypothetical protein